MDNKENKVTDYDDSVDNKENKVTDHDDSVDNKENKVTDHDDSVIIEDSFSPVIATRRSARTESKSAADCTILCEYPVGTRDSVTVSSQDYVTLQHDTFLNDIIIDFYLTHLAHNVLPPSMRDSVHIFSTMFYKRLLQAPKKNAKKVADYESDPSLSAAEKRHFRVAGWTKTVDLFSKDMVVVPICEHDHWYLVVVIRPGLIINPPKSEERILKGEPFVIVLDSLGGTKTSAVTNIRQYLAQEWRLKKCLGAEPAQEFGFTSAEMKTLRPAKPEQENGSDCGVYLLQYVENIFKNPHQFLCPNLPNLQDWFTFEEIERKREDIAQIIKLLATEQRPEAVINFPNIKLKEPRKRTRALKPEGSSSNEQLRPSDLESRVRRVTRSVTSLENDGGAVVTTASSRAVNTIPSRSPHGGAVVTTASSRSVTITSSRLVTTTSSRLVTTTSSKSVTTTSSKSVTTTSSRSVTSTSSRSHHGGDAVTKLPTSLQDISSKSDSSSNVTVRSSRYTRNSTKERDQAKSVSKENDRKKKRRHGLEEFKSLQV